MLLNQFVLAKKLESTNVVSLSDIIDNFLRHIDLGILRFKNRTAILEYKNHLDLVPQHVEIKEVMKIKVILLGNDMKGGNGYTKDRLTNLDVQGNTKNGGVVILKFMML